MDAPLLFRSRARAARGELHFRISAWNKLCSPESPPQFLSCRRAKTASSPALPLSSPSVSAYREYMRKSSAAKSAASSPPVPARISTMTLFSSLGSLGSSSSFSSRSTISLRATSCFSSSCASLLHFGIFGFADHLVRAGQIFFDLLELAMLLDDLFELGVLLGDFLKIAKSRRPARPSRAAGSVRRSARPADLIFRIVSLQP